MSKKNKWRILPFIALPLLIALLIYFAVKKPSKPAEPIKAIPVSASFVIQINDFRALIEKTSRDFKIWKELRAIPVLERIDRQIHFVDSLSVAIPEFGEIMDNPPYFISAHYTGNGKISLMHIFHLPKKIKGAKLNSLIDGLITNSGTIRIRKYEGTDIHEVSLLDRSKVRDFSFAVYNDILLVSFSTTVLEDAIRQLNTQESLLSVSGFTRIYATAGKNVDANVFLNFNEIPRALSAFVKTDYKAEIRSFKNFADWAELDVNPLSDMLLMNGFVNQSDSVQTMASVLLSQTSQRISVDEVLPSSVASFLSISIDDPEEYFKNYRKYLSEQGRLTVYMNTLQSVNHAYGTNFPNDFFEIMDKEIALGIDGTAITDSAGGAFFVMRIKSRTQTEQKMASILQSMLEVDTRSVKDFTTHYRLDEDLSFDIYRLPVRKLIAKIFGNVFSVLDEHYFVVLDNFLVFSNSEKSLKTLIHSYVLNKTLKNDPTYKEFKNSLSPKSNLCFYGNLFRSQPYYSAFINSDFAAAWEKNLAVFQNVQVMGIQLYKNNNMLYSNMLIRHLSSVNTMAQTVWESKLDTLVNCKPVFVQNHQTGQNEVFVQDLNNTIYLINHVGRILWKIKLAERINSEIFQIDYYRNGKLQLMFSTAHEIYLIDRNGNFVGKYPVKLREPATNGLAVFDYDNNRDYRLFIACSDRHVYAYDRTGTLVPGWEFGQSESEIKQPLNHFRIGNRDFIVFGDQYKTYILDRKGGTRVNVETYFPRSQNNNYTLSLETPASIVTTDTTGKVYFIGFNGQVTTVELAKFSSLHFFDYRDLTGDNQPEYIFADGNILYVYGHDESKLFTFKQDETIMFKPQHYQFSSTDKKLGLVSPGKNLIYLINNTGELYKGFPLQGNTPFSIGNFSDTLSRFNLVVGSKDNFLYNYRVN